MTPSWLDTPLVHALGWTLMHTLWQAALIALIIRLLWRPASLQRPRLRYGLGLAAMVAILAGASVTFTYYYLFYRDLASAALLSAEVELWGANGPATAGSQPEHETTSSLLASLTHTIENYLPALVLAWLLGALTMGFRLAGGWQRLRRLSRTGLADLPVEWAARFTRLAGKMGVRRNVTLRFSRLATSPMTLHHLKPVILFPVGLINQLTVEQVEAILLHELAHIRRWDYLVNWLQSILELLFFYHPAVWWLSGQVREAREHCCDDLVLQQGGVSRKTYAQALTQLTAISITARSPANRSNGRIKTKLAMSVNGINGAFTQRIKRLFGHYETVVDWRKPVLSTLIGLAVLSGLAWAAQPAEGPQKISEEPAPTETADSFEIVPFIRVAELELAFSKTSGPLTLISQLDAAAEASTSEGVFTANKITYGPNGNGKENVIASAKSLVLKLKRPLTQLWVDDKSWGVDVHQLEQLNAESLETLVWDGDQHVLQVFTTGQTPANLVYRTPDSNRQAYALPTDTLPAPEKQPAAESPLPVPEKTGDTKIRLRSPNADQQPLYILDGKVLGRDETKIQEVDPEDISHINVLKGEKATQQYGPEGKDGVIEIFTKEGNAKTNPPAEVMNQVETPEQTTPPNTNLSIRPGADQDPLIVVDGKVLGRDSKKLQQIDPGDISHINVLKGESATRQYGPEGEDGAIEIITKNAPSKTAPQKTRPRDAAGKATIRVQPPLSDAVEPVRPPSNPLFVIDGKIIGQRDTSFFNQIDPSTIDRINVIKTIDAVKRYGPAAEHGVVEVFTKKGDGQYQAPAAVIPAEKEQPATGSTFREQLEASVFVYPTPFSNEVNIAFTLPERAATRVSIFTMDGRLVQTLIDETLEAAEYQLPWAPGQRDAGNYVVQIEAGNAVISRKLIKQ